MQNENATQSTNLAIEAIITQTPAGAAITRIRDVWSCLPEGTVSFFDDKHAVMQQGHDRRAGEWRFAYQGQIEEIEATLTPGLTVLDIGCGPSIPYARPTAATLLGADPSFESIRQNRDVDCKLHASASDLPLASRSVDLIICLYSIHHMIGASLQATAANVDMAFQEFSRVLKPGGQLLVFEMTPNLFFSALQRAMWDSAIKLLPKYLDMYFWPSRDLLALAASKFPRGTTLETKTFNVPALTLFPPVFAIPWLQVPRFIYPLSPRLYKWTIPVRDNEWGTR
jgi:ubiquinone/menaquinone biosynthesis C-methylase UbiE